METPVRKAQLLALALDLAEDVGLDNVTRNLLAERAGCSRGRIANFWKNGEFRDAVMQAAVDQSRLYVIAQGIALRHPIAEAAPLAVRRAAIETLL